MRAIKALEGPDEPEAFRHLAEWVYALHGRSGVGMAGVAPLSYPTIEAWARLTHRTVTPWECEALVTLDAILCYPDAGEDDG